jgi:hypothetical protein
MSTQTPEVPAGLEALADVFLEKARAEPIEVVDAVGRHWLLAWRSESEPSVEVHLLDRRTPLPALAEVTAHDLSALLAWGMEPRPRSPLQPIPDRAWRLLGLEHPLAEAVRRSRSDVLLLRCHGLPEGFTVEAARAGLSVYVADARRPRGEGLLPLVLWAWSGRGVWPPMRRAMPPGDLLQRIVSEAPPLRSVEELASALRRLARMPSTQAWSARELGELRAVLEPFGIALPPVEIVDVDRDGGVTVTWRGDRLVAATPNLERMSAAELEAAASMLDGFVPPHVQQTFRDAAEKADAAVAALATELPGTGIFGRDPRRPTTRRSAAAAPELGGRTIAGPAAAAIAAHTETPVDAQPRVTPLAVPTIEAQPDARRAIAPTRREAAASVPTIREPTKPTPIARPVTPPPSEAPTRSSPAPAPEVVADEWLERSLTPAGAVAEPTDLRAALAAQQETRASPSIRDASSFGLPGSVSTWVFVAGVVLGFGLGFLVGEQRAGRDGIAASGDVELPVAVTPSEPAAPVDTAVAAADAVDAAGATEPTDDLADEDPIGDSSAERAPVEAAAAAAAPAEAEPAADVPAAAEPAAAARAVPTGPGFAALPAVALWDGSNAPWREAGVRARCNLHGDLELEQGGDRKVLVCGVYYTQDGHLLRYGTCANGPVRCVDIRRGRAGTRPFLCTPRSGRPLVRFRQKKGEQDRYTSDIEIRKLFDKWRKDPSKPMCEGAASYWREIDRRWLDAGPPPSDEQPAGARPAGATDEDAATGGD